jgi:hypothetical protein
VTLDEELIEELGSFAYDPLGFVMWAFPWGEPGELAKFSGPDEWQLSVLRDLRDGVISTSEAVRIATASGHGVGKSALVGWLVWWAYSTFPGTRGVVTANTENQLKTKTWVEIAKWHRLFIAKHLFKCTATAIFSVDETTAREWRIDIVPWSKNNPEAFAGLHNKSKRILVVFDEASTIEDIIWETTEGALTDSDTEIIWVVFGNPTKNTGRFRECFDTGRFAHRWKQHRVDSRTVKITNKAEIANWIKDYGVASDFIKVRVLGEFPANDASSFISYDAALAATAREYEDQRGLPIILGVDVARFGDDCTVIYPRQGRDARSRLPLVLRGLSTVEVAQHVLSEYFRLGASVVMVDGGGVGGGVVDQLRLTQIPVIDVQFGAKPSGSPVLTPGILYANKRAEIWGELREFINTVGCIPDRVKGLDRTFPAELSAPQYTLDAKQGIQLESKAMMKSRGQASPDLSDALACTFAMPWNSTAKLALPKAQADYNPFSEDAIYA